ncbi:MAG: DUF1189 family protein [Gammaproteobacteria bacterium]|nr:DUF1189 family protein [Gammaproteobacteria bacterium]
MQPLLRSIVLAFHSEPLYREVARRWQGRAFVYLLVLIAIAWTLLFVRFVPVQKDELTILAEKYITQVPAVHIADGVATVDALQPYEIRDPDSGRVVAILDTTGEVTTLEGTDAGMLLTRNQVISRENQTETRAFDLGHIEALTVDQDLLRAIVAGVLRWGPVVAWPLAILTSFIFRILQAIVYAAIGLMLQSMLHVSLGFNVLLTLAMVAITPAIVVGTVLELATLPLPFQGLLLFLLAMAYLAFAIRANRGATAAPATPPPP